MRLSTRRVNGEAIRYSIQYLTVISLILLIGSGIYDIVAGVQASNWYMHWHAEHYGAMSVWSVINNYALGVFRGTVVTLGGGAALVQTARGKVRWRVLALLGVFVYWYAGSLLHHAYKGVALGDWVQLGIAVLCLGTASARKFVRV